MKGPETEEEMKNALKLAQNCRHYAMCKVDFLGSGVCQSGLQNHYVSYYPQGRMDLFTAIVTKSIPITEKCIEIINGCNLCGKCDYQCYFVHEMRPTKVMKALKDYIDEYLKNGGEIDSPKEDKILMDLKKIVGDFWVTNDPAINIAYHHDLCPHVEYKMPKYVIMPNSKEEISSVIKLLNHFDIPYVVRGNGASSHGLVFSEGAVLDLNRMKMMDFDEKNWKVKVGPGIASFDLQSEAKKRGYRVHTAEPASLVCANIMTSGLLSTYSTAYGIAADNLIDAEFIARDGSFFSLNDINSPNLFSYQNSVCEQEALAICVSVSVKLHPVTKDEEGILVPFETFEEALGFAKECALRRIGLAIGLLGGEFLSTFLAPSKKLAHDVKEIFSSKLGISYIVLLVGDRFAIRSVKDMGYPIIDQKLFKILCQALPSLKSAKWLDLLNELTDDEPFSYLKLGKFSELAEIALSPSPAQMVQDTDEELKPFFERLYSRPEMSDLVWLNTFRIQSSRYCREFPCVALVCFVPIDEALITEIQTHVKEIAQKYSLKNEFGFITPFDNGKRCVWEYDYYFNHKDPDEMQRIRQATFDAFSLLDGYSKKTGTVKQVRYVTNRGCCRKENLLYL